MITLTVFLTPRKYLKLIQGNLETGKDALSTKFAPGERRFE